MKTFITIFVFFWGMQASFSQKVYVDYKPQYTEWVRNYIVDKIEYTKEHTIFYFRYLSSSAYSAMDFRGIRNEYRWCLENVDNPDETYYLVDLRNIRVDGVLHLERIGDLDMFYYNPKATETVTCEVYFPRLPKHIKKAHFLEGKSAKNRTNHFHALAVNLKTFDDPDLGSEADRTARIQKFKDRVLTPVNQRYTIYTPNNSRTPKQNTLTTGECKARM